MNRPRSYDYNDDGERAYFPLILVFFGDDGFEINDFESVAWGEKEDAFSNRQMYT